MTIPRKCRLDLATPPEVALRTALEAVEAMPADTRLMAEQSAAMGWSAMLQAAEWTSGGPVELPDWEALPADQRARLVAVAQAQIDTMQEVLDGYGMGGLFDDERQVRPGVVAKKPYPLRPSK